MKEDRPKVKTPTWICIECYHKRGYRRPDNKEVAATVRPCDACSKYTICMDRSHLLGPQDDVT